MDATVNDLIATIGEQTLEIRLLKQAMAEGLTASNLKDQEITKLNGELETEKAKSGGLTEILDATGKKKGK